VLRRLTTNTIQAETISIEVASPIVRVIEPEAVENNHVMKGYDAKFSRKHVRRGIVDGHIASSGE
jgi:hypothetical protein